MNKFATIDGNEAVSRVAYRLNEVIAIYPNGTLVKLKVSGCKDLKIREIK